METAFTTTAEQRAKIMGNLVDKTAEHLSYLQSRWQDEKKYEDFNDYIKSFKDKVKEVLPMAEVLSMTKKFEITIKVPGFPYNPIIYMTSKHIGWKSK